jgi:hypothetical protein
MSTDYNKYNLDTLTTKDDQSPVVTEVFKHEARDVSEDTMLLQRCRAYWDSLSGFRERRERSRKYYRGFQWGDKVFNPETGGYVTEDSYIRSQGKVPLKQNHYNMDFRIMRLGKRM